MLKKIHRRRTKPKQIQDRTGIIHESFPIGSSVSVVDVEFLLHDILGAGGYALVFRAIKSQNGAVFALKITNLRTEGRFINFVCKTYRFFICH